jgi:hypothetical protein
MPSTGHLDQRFQSCYLQFQALLMAFKLRGLLLVVLLLTSWPNHRRIDLQGWNEKKSGTFLHTSRGHLLLCLADCSRHNLSHHLHCLLELPYLTLHMNTSHLTSIIYETISLSYWIFSPQCASLTHKHKWSISLTTNSLQFLLYCSHQLINTHILQWF